MKRGILIFIIIILAVSLAGAVDFNVNHDAIHSKVLLGEEALFNLTIENTKTIDDTFRFSIDNARWNMFTDPTYVKNTGLDVAREGFGSVLLSLKPRENVLGGRNIITLVIDSERTSQSMTHELEITVNKEGSMGYVADVFADVLIDEVVDPREDLIVKVNLKNRNPRDIDDLLIKLSSQTFTKEVHTTLGPNEEKIEVVRIMLDPLTRPVDDMLVSVLQVNDTVFTPTKKSFKVLDYTGEFLAQVQETKEFLKTTRHITFTNTGNNRVSQFAKLETTLIQSVFSSTEPKHTAVIKSDGMRYLAWDTELEPEESLEVTVVLNYRWFYGLLLVVVLVVLYMYLTKSPVMIKKTASHVVRGEGGISEMKVSLNIKNRTGKNLEKLEVRDIVPNIADLLKEFGVGTLAPDRTFRNAKGNTVLRWNFTDLDPHEERIITYKIKSRLSIVGDFELPVAIIKFKDKKGNDVVVKSNRLSISSTVAAEE
ncbi:hypothetical protein KY330_04375 [Candidatus Woesearchaeota archaeon]|nr:hypothetical protein [Candidatus Woesearchaeota archaeon]